MIYSHLLSMSASSICSIDESLVHQYLPIEYKLGPNDVFCGRGSQCFNHSGNVRFRNIVANYLPRYSKPLTKLEKSKIISDVVEEVQTSDPNGGFIKQDLGCFRYYEVSDIHAREKTSQAFRDALVMKSRITRFPQTVKATNCFKRNSSSLLSMVRQEKNQHRGPPSSLSWNEGYCAFNQHKCSRNAEFDMTMHKTATNEYFCAKEQTLRRLTSTPSSEEDASTFERLWQFTIKNYRYDGHQNDYEPNHIGF